MEVSLNYCSQNGGNSFRTPYYNRNPNIGPRIDSNLGQSPHVNCRGCMLLASASQEVNPKTEKLTVKSRRDCRCWLESRRFKLPR